MNDDLVLTPPSEINTDDFLFYINHFFGYGNLKSPVWYIGGEEAGSGNWCDINKRIEAVKRLGRNRDLVVANARDFHESNWSKAYNNPTWCHLRLLHSILFPDQNLNQNNWLDTDGDLALLDLYPLPKPKISSDSVIKNLKDSEGTLLTQLKGKHLDKYYDICRGPRIEKLRKAIVDNPVELIVCFGKSYWNQPKNQTAFEMLCSPAVPQSSGDIKFASYAYCDRTVTYLEVPHPTQQKFCAAIPDIKSTIEWLGSTNFSASGQR